MSKRIVGFDYLKVLLAFLVICGHILQRRITCCGEDDDIVFYMYYFIYSFHMPLFIFISGYFLYGKSLFILSFIKCKFWQLIFPCLFWGVFLTSYDYLFKTNDILVLSKDFVTNQLWYLKSYFLICILMLPFLTTSKYRLHIAFLSWLIGMISGAFFLLATQVPAFLLGWYAHSKEKECNKWRFPILSISLLIFVIELLFIHPSINVNELNYIRTGNIMVLTDYIHRILLAFSGCICFFLIFLNFRTTPLFNGLGGGNLKIYPRYIYYTESLGRAISF